MRSRNTLLASIICILGAAFYMYEFVLQVSVSVMTTELMQDLSLSAATLGVISSFYYYAYTPMQIPAGLIHDRFGPRAVLTCAILTCSLGAFFFSTSNSILSASIGRLFMGFGSAFSFSGALILISRWFPPRSFPTLSGVVQLMSCLGAIFGVVPLAFAVTKWSWRPTMFYLSLFGFALALIVWIIVRDSSTKTAPHNNGVASSANKRNLKLIFMQSQSWWIAFYSFLVWAPIAAFAGLWGIPFLVSAYNLTTAHASIICSAIWVGIGVSAPLIGLISEYLQKRCIVLTICSLLGAIGSVGVIYFMFPFYIVYLLLFLIGCAGSAQSLAFSVVRENNLPNVMGAAIGLNNMATVAGGAIFQPLIGFILEYHASLNATSSSSAPNYTTANYRMALIMIPICYLISAFVSAKFIKETNCKMLHVANGQTS